MGKRVKNTKVGLEEYEHFLHNPYDEYLSYHQLNQIIYLHGFKKIHKRRKRELYEALSTIDMLKPQRSTLNDYFSPYDSSLSLDQVKQDLEALEWQECPVQSVQIVNPSHEDEQGVRSNGCDRISKDLESSSFKISRKRMRSRRQRRRMMESIRSDGGDAQQNNVVAGGDVADQFVDTYNWEL